MWPEGGPGTPSSETGEATGEFRGRGRHTDLICIVKCRLRGRVEDGQRGQLRQKEKATPAAVHRQAGRPCGQAGTGSHTF